MVSPSIEAAAPRLVESLEIPSCPAILMDISREMKREFPDMRKVAQFISADPGLAAQLLKLVNSPAMGLSTRIQSVAQALAMLGLNRVASLVSGLVLKQVFATGRQGPTLERFWDVSHKRALVMARLARELPGVNADVAYTFGLFMDCGIAVLMSRFPEYKDTLALANTSTDRVFTEFEDDRHFTNHAVVGYWLANSWRLGDTLPQAILRHHDYTFFDGALEDIDDGIGSLVALGLLSERLIQVCAGGNQSVEWAKGGEAVLSWLGLDDEEFAEFEDEVREVLGAL